MGGGSSVPPPPLGLGGGVLGAPPPGPWGGGTEDPPWALGAPPPWALGGGPRCPPPGPWGGVLGAPPPGPWGGGSSVPPPLGLGGGSSVPPPPGPWGGVLGAPPLGLGGGVLGAPPPWALGGRLNAWCAPACPLRWRLCPYQRRDKFRDKMDVDSFGSPTSYQLLPSISGMRCAQMCARATGCRTCGASPGGAGRMAWYHISHREITATIQSPSRHNSHHSSLRPAFS